MHIGILAAAAHAAANNSPFTVFYNPRLTSFILYSKVSSLFYMYRILDCGGESLVTI